MLFFFYIDIFFFFFFFFFFFNDTATTEIYTRPYTLSLHDALPIYDVVLGLLRRQHAPRGLRVEAQGQRPRIARAERVPHNPGPEPPRRPELRDFFDEVVVGVEEERELRRELVDREAGVERRADVGHTVGERERDLLDRGGARLAHVIPRDRDRVPARHVVPAVGEGVGDQPHRGGRGEDVGPARDVLLEDVVLHGPGQGRRGDPTPLRRGHVEGEQDGRRGVDRHRRGHAVERDPLEEVFHVLDRGDRDPHLADFAARHRRVRVIAHLRRQIEGDRQPRLALLEQEAVALVRLGGRAETGVLPHGPVPRPVHLAVDPARERKRAGLAEVVPPPVASHVVRTVHGLERRGPRGLGVFSPGRHRGRFPCFRGGLASRLVRTISRAAMRRARVSLGSMTSSM